MKQKFVQIKLGADVVARFCVHQPRHASFNDAVKNFSSISTTWRRNNCPYPCLACGGDGWYRKIEDRCPVEGYKMAPRYTCESCQGTGGGSKEAFKVLYDHDVSAYQAKKAQFDADLKLFVETLELLTPDQVKIMKKMLGHFDSLPKEGDSVRTIKVKK